MPPKGTDSRIPYVCGECGATFRVWQSRRNASSSVYCSQPCYHASKVIPPADRFWKHVDTSGDCWLWTGAKHDFGYGKFGVGPGKSPMNTHRYSWILHNGPVPDGLSVLHTCDVPACVRPEHLYLGTHDDNMADMAVRKRAGRRKLTEDDMIQIRRMLAKDLKHADIASQFGVSDGLIWHIVHRRIWKHVT